MGMCGCAQCICAVGVILCLYKCVEVCGGPCMCACIPSVEVGAGTGVCVCVPSPYISHIHTHTHYTHCY